MLTFIPLDNLFHARGRNATVESSPENAEMKNLQHISIENTSTKIGHCRGFGGDQKDIEGVSNE